MAKKKKSALPSVEILIILVFFGSFILWAMSQCNAKQLFYEQLENPERTRPREEAAIVEPEIEAPPENPPISPPTTTPPTTAPATAPAQVIVERFTPLYVTIDSLNMRELPSLSSRILTKLNLYEEVAFMNEITETTQVINLNGREVDEPWIKIKTNNGIVGWVYGAGVHFYRIKTDKEF